RAGHVPVHRDPGLLISGAAFFLGDPHLGRGPARSRGPNGRGLPSSCSVCSMFTRNLHPGRSLSSGDSVLGLFMGCEPRTYIDRTGRTPPEWVWLSLYTRGPTSGFVRVSRG